MRLRTFESFWLLKNGLLYSYPSLNTNIYCEVAVIGGGISGALTSHALTEAGCDVILLDKGDIGQGSSAATTSMLQYEIDVPLHKLAGMIGEDGASICYKAGIDAIKKIQSLIEKYNINCGFGEKHSLYIAHNRKAAKDLYVEFEMRNKHHLGVQWLSAAEVMTEYKIKCYGAILSDAAASVDAYKLTHELIKMNTARGLRVFDQTHLEKFELDKETPTITTANGNIISCKKVIFCSGYEATNMLKENIADLFYTYATVSERNINIPQKLNDTLIWDTNNPYLYMRTTDDGRLLIGGEDSSNNISFFKQKIKERKAARLMKDLKKILPEVNFIQDFNWGGTFGSTKDGLPYIGESPEFKNALFVLGFGGNGITFSIQAMDIIVDLLKGHQNQLAYYYRFGR